MLVHLSNKARRLDDAFYTDIKSNLNGIIHINKQEKICIKHGKIM